MSVMSVGKKPKALVRSLGAGNSRAGGIGASRARVTPARQRPGQTSEVVPACPVAAQPGVAGPARPRATARKPSARPRLMGSPGRRRSRRRRAGGGGGQMLRGQRLRCRGRGCQPTTRFQPGRAAPGRPADRGALADARGPACIGAVPGAGPAGAADQAHPARAPGGLGFRGSPPGRGAHPGPARPGVRCAGGQSRPASRPAVRASMRHVVVKPGQSLWSIALNAEPQADPRTVIQQIIEFNALGSQVVVPGESLWVPRG